jgi:Skp family chaperone for outer membrane proteins
MRSWTSSPIASNSSAGKEASKKLDELGKKKQAELADKNKQLQGAHDQARHERRRDERRGAAHSSKRTSTVSSARSSSRSRAPTPRFQDLQNELQGEFQKRLIPIIEELAKEKGLYMIFTGESGFAYVYPGLNLSDEVIKRLDAKK